MEREAQPKCHRNTHTRSTQRRQPWCARLYGPFVFMLPYVFRLQGFFVLSKLNRQAIIHDASREPVEQRPVGQGAVMSGYCRTGRMLAGFIARHHNKYRISTVTCKVNK